MTNNNLLTIASQVACGFGVGEVWRIQTSDIQNIWQMTDVFKNILPITGDCHRGFVMPVTAACSLSEFLFFES
jgi:hypothetical protein